MLDGNGAAFTPGTFSSLAERVETRRTPISSLSRHRGRRAPHFSRLGYLKRSFSLPFFSLAVPLLWSERPSDFLVSSPVTAPAASFARPFALSIAPSLLSCPLLFLPT